MQKKLKTRSVQEILKKKKKKKKTKNKTKQKQEQKQNKTKKQQQKQKENPVLRVRPTHIFHFFYLLKSCKINQLAENFILPWHAIRIVLNMILQIFKELCLRWLRKSARKAGVNTTCDQGIVRDAESLSICEYIFGVDYQNINLSLLQSYTK